ncbi:MAG: hypothetical protein EOP45_22280 [Sphingobacteriaceae bacterium]|nr:MAG: hypothetical protein EOP45_22280 [Sphingobacteriaceae bacterium]
MRSKSMINELQQPEKESYYFELEEDLIESLRKLAQCYKISLYSLLLSAYYLTLRVYDKQDQTVLLAPYINLKSCTKLENHYHKSLFVNLVKFGTCLDSSKSTIEEFIRKIDQHLIQVPTYPDLSSMIKKLSKELITDKGQIKYLIALEVIDDLEITVSSKGLGFDKDYFKVLGAKLLDGRFFESSDTESAPQVVIVSDVFAKKMWPNESSLGKKIQINPKTDGEWLTVVGVIRQILQTSPDDTNINKIITEIRLQALVEGGQSPQLEAAAKDETIILLKGSYRNPN